MSILNIPRQSLIHALTPYRVTFDCLLIWAKGKKERRKKEKKSEEKKKKNDDNPRRKIEFYVESF